MTDILKPKQMFLASCELHTSYCNIYLFTGILVEALLCIKTKYKYKEKYLFNKIKI